MAATTIYDTAVLKASIVTPQGLDQIVFEFPNHPFDLSDLVPPLVPSKDLISHSLPTTTDSDPKLHARVEYCAARLSLLPYIFASTGQNMFIHRQTMQAVHTPSLQQAMSACALYAIKTPHTQAVVHQVLQSNVQDLLASTDPSSSSYLNLLTATQALLLYQLMRLFDGDDQLRLSAEADEAITLLWAKELRLRVCHVAPRQDKTAPASFATFSRTPEDEEWLAWLFSESIRRTVVTAFMLQGVYNYHKMGDSTPAVIGVYFTAQAALWDAQSEMSWQ